jgi:hypothetical protein
MPICDYDDELTHTAGPPATSKQSIVGVAATAIVGGTVKDGGAARDWGAGELRLAFLRCVTALVGATGGVQVDIVTADNAALTTNPVVLSTRTIAAAALLANTLHALPPLAAGTRKRYLGVKLTPLATNSTAGEVIVGFMDKDGRPQDGVNWL